MIEVTIKISGKNEEELKAALEAASVIWLRQPTPLLSRELARKILKKHKSAVVGFEVSPAAS